MIVCTTADKELKGAREAGYNHTYTPDWIESSAAQCVAVASMASSTQSVGVQAVWGLSHSVSDACAVWGYQTRGFLGWCDTILCMASLV